VREQRELAVRTARLSRSFWEQLRTVLPGAVLNGPPLDAGDEDTRRLPNTIHVTLPTSAQPMSARSTSMQPGVAPIDGRMLVARLDLEGLEVSSGSACASGSLEPSHVLLALGHAPERARNGVRVSFGRESDVEDVHTAVDILRRTFLALR